MNYFATGKLLPAEDMPKRRHDEADLQRAVVEYLRWSLPLEAVFYSIPNEGKRGRKTVAQLIGTGLRAGMPDLAVVHCGRSIFIELKTPRGALSPSQRQMHARLHMAGAAVHVCRSVPQVEACLRALDVPLQARVAA